MRCWLQAGAEPELLRSGRSVRQLCPSRLHLQDKDSGRVGQVKRRAKRGCVAYSMECKREHCKGVASVLRGCHTKSLDVPTPGKVPVLFCPASGNPPQGESPEPSTLPCGSLARQAGLSMFMQRTQGRALRQDSVRPAFLVDQVSFPRSRRGRVGDGSRTCCRPPGVHGAYPCACVCHPYTHVM